MGLDARRILEEAVTGLLVAMRRKLGATSTGTGDELDVLLTAVNQAATEAAQAARYLRSQPKATTPDWGRRVGPHDLERLGVTGAMGAGPDDILLRNIAAELCGYLAGPDVTCEAVAVLDAGLPLTTGHEVAGWRLEIAGPDLLGALTPLPSTRQFARDPWDKTLLHGRCAMLQAPDSGIVPASSTSSLFEGMTADLFEAELIITAWAPLLLLNLTAHERVTIAAEYEIEPGRWVRRTRGDGVGLTEAGDEHQTWEVPAWGPYQPSAAETEDVLRAVTTLSPLLAAFTPAAGATKKQRQPEARLRRCAHRLLAQGTRLGMGGDALLPRDRAELLFLFVSALENLVVTEQGGGGDLNRKVFQRTAMLIGTGDADRIEIYETVKQAYELRSKFAHGDAIDVSGLHDLVLRRVSSSGVMRL